MYLFRQYHRQIDEFIGSRSKKGFLIAWAFLLMALGALAVLAFTLGAPVINGYAGDTSVLLDGAWRIANGQVPHRDFYSFLGDLPFYVTLLGIKVAKPCVSAIDYGNAILMIPTGVTAMLLLQRRTSALCAFLFSVFVALLIITPRALGSPYDYTDHAMLYNRYGEAFATLLGIVLFIPTRLETTAGIWHWAEPLLVGFLIVAALGCKINYFIVSIGFVAAAVLARRISLTALLAVLISAGVFFALALAITKIPVKAMVHDYQMISAAQSLSSKFRRIAIQGSKVIVCLPILLLPVWEARLATQTSNDSRKPLWLHSFVIFVIVGGDILLLASNNQVKEGSLLVLAALYGFEILQRQPRLSGEAPESLAARPLRRPFSSSGFFVPERGDEP